MKTFQLGKRDIVPDDVEKEQLSSEDLFQSLIEDYTTKKQKVIQDQRLDMLSKEDVMDDVIEHIRKYYHTSAAAQEEALHKFEQFIFGYSRLTPLIDDLEITDIHCISYDNIWYKKNGVRYRSDIKFINKLEYQNFIDYVVTKNHVNNSNMNAMQRFADNTTIDHSRLRFSLTMPLVNMLGEPYLHIRKRLKDFPELEDLVEKKMLSPELAKELYKRFSTGSTLICGGNSSGKTSLLDALKEKLPENMTVMVSQQIDELSTKRDTPVMFMHSLPGTSETEISYELDKISDMGLTMDPDYFLLGEIKGKEAAYVLNAAYAGQLCAATLHSPSAKQAPDRMTDLCLHHQNYTKEQMMKMCCCFKNIIFMDKYKVAQVYEVVGWNDKKKDIDYKVVYELDAQKEGDC